MLAERPVRRGDLEKEKRRSRESIGVKEIIETKGDREEIALARWTGRKGIKTGEPHSARPEDLQSLHPKQNIVVSGPLENPTR